MTRTTTQAAPDGIYAAGDTVDVKMTGVWRQGEIVAVFDKYDWTGETKYKIHGDGFTTICSKKLLRKRQEAAQ